MLTIIAILKANTSNGMAGLRQSEVSSIRLVLDAVLQMFSAQTA